MPSGFLHSHCADLALKRANLTVAHPDAFLFGAQGPDPLFTLGVFPLRPKSQPSHYGTLLHTARTGRFLSALCAEAKDATGVERAYAMGFLTHYALDSTVHPFVYAHSLDESGEYQSALHIRLENNWDALYASRAGMKKTPDAQRDAVVNAKACWEAAAALLSSAMTTVYENTLPPEEIIKAYQGTEQLGKLLSSRFAYVAAYLLERLTRMPKILTAQFFPRKLSKDDIENTARAQWRAVSEPDRLRDEGLTELFEAAIVKSCELLQVSDAFFAGDLSADELAKTIGNAGYDTGLESLP